MLSLQPLRSLRPLPQALLDQMGAAVGHVNLYNVYGECISGSQDVGAHKVPFQRNFLGSASQVGGPDACINSIAGSTYFNQPAVLAAAHVKKQACHRGIEWPNELDTACGLQLATYSLRPTACGLQLATYSMLLLLVFSAFHCPPPPPHETAISMVDVRQSDPLHLHAQEPAACAVRLRTSATVQAARSSDSVTSAR